MDCLFGLTCVYRSAQAEGFGDAGRYPLAWEVVFVNNGAGRKFSWSIREAFGHVPRKSGFILKFEGEASGGVRCLECVFRDKAAFRQVLDDGMKGLAIFDEDEKTLVHPGALLGKADALLENPALLCV